MIYAQTSLENWNIGELKYQISTRNLALVLINKLF